MSGVVMRSVRLFGVDRSTVIASVTVPSGIHTPGLLLFDQRYFVRCKDGYQETQLFPVV